MSMKTRLPLLKSAEALAKLKATPFHQLLYSDVIDALLAKMGEDETCSATLRIRLGGRLYGLSLHLEHEEDEEEEELSPEDEKAIADVLRALGVIK